MGSPSRLSYKIIDLFSEGLYSSPNKAIEELVANSFDAGATTVHIMMSNDLHHPRSLSGIRSLQLRINNLQTRDGS